MKRSITSWYCLFASAAFGLLAIAVGTNTFLIKVNIDSAKNILIAILGTSAALFGFIIFNLTVAFEKYKKDFGRSVTKVFRKDSNIRLLVAWIITVMVVSFTGLLFADTKSVLFTGLFNLSCVYFLGALNLVRQYAILIQASLSVENYTSILISKLQVEDFVDHDDKELFPMPVKTLVEIRNTNPTIELFEIITTNIRERNTDSILIISNLFEWISVKFSDKTVSVKSKRIIAINFLHLLNNSFDLFLQNKDELSVKELIQICERLDMLISVHGELYKSMERLFETVYSFAGAVIEQKNESLVWETLWLMYNISKCHINRNIPKDYDLWDHTDEGKEYPYRSQSPFAHEQRMVFDLISKFITLDIPEIFDRILRCRNHFIIDQSLGVFCCILDMLLMEDGIELPQRNSMAGSISFSLANTIKEVIKLNVPHKFAYLHYHLSPSQMLRAIKWGSELGHSVFNEYLYLAEFIRDEGKFDKADVEILAGLGRLLIASHDDIHFPETYISSIIKLLREVHNIMKLKLANNRMKAGERENITLIINQIADTMRSFYSCVHRALYKNDRLILTVAGLNHYQV